MSINVNNSHTALFTNNTMPNGPHTMKMPVHSNVQAANASIMKKGGWKYPVSHKRHRRRRSTATSSSFYQPSGSFFTLVKRRHRRGKKGGCGRRTKRTKRRRSSRNRK
jgi:hypothetical protein